MLDKFSDELREKRLQSGITLEQMANKTRIDQKFLEAIDEGNFAFLPELYVKAFIKQYAKEVGLEEAETLKRYQSAKEGKLFQPEKEISQPDPELENNFGKQASKISGPSPKTQPLKSYNDPSVEKRQAESDNAGKDKILIAAAIIGILVIIIAVYLFFIRDTKEIIVAERPFEEVIEQNQQRYIEETPETEDDPTILTSDSLYLKFISSEPSWIFVVIDNIKTEEFTLAPNIEHIVSAGNSFKSTVGNSGGVKLTLNNNPVEFTGRSGSVRHFSIDREGFRYLNTPPKLDR
ncbi:MAG TPA: helix-turn-helix domain-containing protein [Ignavibacteriaceae bacterium]|nr:helix-turn-helix domain-containing protein [Ignavibacteriaceae bacterium]